MPKSDGYKNLIAGDKRSQDEARINGAKGGKRSGEVRRAKKTLRKLAQEWADCEPTADELAKLAEIGITDEGVTRKATLLIPLLSNVFDGDLRALQVLIELLGEDNRKDAELAKLRAELDLVRAETDKLRREIGDDSDERSVLDKLCDIISNAAQK